MRIADCHQINDRQHLFVHGQGVLLTQPKGRPEFLRLIAHLFRSAYVPGPEVHIIIKVFFWFDASEVYWSAGDTYIRLGLKKEESKQSLFLTVKQP